MNRKFLIFGIVILILAVALIAFNLGRTSSPSKSSIAEPTQGIVSEEEVDEPTPEPTNKVDETQSIVDAVLKKLEGGSENLEVNITQKTESHAKGTITDKEGGGGYFLAAKQDSEWVVVHDGQTNPTCEQIAPYNFPKDMVPECLDSSGNPVQR